MEMWEWSQKSFILVGNYVKRFQVRPEILTEGLKIFLSRDREV